MAKTDFRQIGFSSPRDTDTALYSADMNAAYGAIQSLQETLNMQLEEKTVNLVAKPYYANEVTYNNRYYELPLENLFFNVANLAVSIDGQVQDSTTYQVVQNNAILFNSQQTVSAVVTVSGYFATTKSKRIEDIEQKDNVQDLEIRNIKNGTTTVKNTENAQKIRAKGGAYKELASALLEMVYPVGSIYMSANSTNPSTFLGGEWTSWGEGKVPVGVNTSDSDFATAGKEGGNKSVTLTIDQMPSHTHIQNPHTHTQESHNHLYSDRSVADSFKTNQSESYNWTTYNSETTHYNQQTTYSQPKINATTATNQNAGGGQAFSLLQPYITCYMFKRIS